MGAIESRGTLIAAALVAASRLALPATASADAGPGQPPPAAALEAAEQALTPGIAPADSVPGPAPATPASADPSLALRDLAHALPRLEGAERRRAKAILARPTDNRDPIGDSYSVPEAAPYCSAHFCVHYVTSSKDAPSLTDAGGIPACPTTSRRSTSPPRVLRGRKRADRLASPKPDGNLGGSSVTDIYLVNVGGEGLFGYSAPDPPPAQSCSRTCFAYLVMDNDFSPAEFGYPDPQVPLEVTIAHEYNHVLQFRQDARTDGWLFESTAVWTEELVFPNDNDYVNSYLKTFARTPQVPVTDFDGGRGLRIYGLATFNHFLSTSAPTGPSVVVGAWTRAPKVNPKDFAAAALDRGDSGPKRPWPRSRVHPLRRRDRRVALAGFPDAASYPDVTRKGSLKKSAHKRVVLDHMAYRLMDVRGAGGGKLKLSLSAGDVRAGVALVGRDDDAGGQVVMKVKYLTKGGRASVTLPSPGDYERVTAVIVNADTRVHGFDNIHRDWNYTRDNAKLTAQPVRLTSRARRAVSLAQAPRNADRIESSRRAARDQRRAGGRAVAEREQEHVGARPGWPRPRRRPRRARVA